MDSRKVVLTPRAHRDLFRLQDRLARRIAHDLRLLESPRWPPGKVKKLRGSGFWEIKTGDYRAIFLPRGKDILIARVVNRRDLERVLGDIDPAAVQRWAAEREE